MLVVIVAQPPLERLFLSLVDILQQHPLRLFHLPNQPAHRLLDFPLIPLPHFPIIELQHRLVKQMFQNRLNLIN